MLEPHNKHVSRRTYTGDWRKRLSHRHGSFYNFDFSLSPAADDTWRHSDISHNSHMSRVLLKRHSTDHPPSLCTVRTQALGERRVRDSLLPALSVFVIIFLHFFHHLSVFISVRPAGWVADWVCLLVSYSYLFYQLMIKLPNVMRITVTSLVSPKPIIYSLKSTSLFCSSTS